MKPESTSSFSTRAEALLGDLQDVEEVGDRQPGIAVDEMQHAVMRAAETDFARIASGSEMKSR